MPLQSDLRVPTATSSSSSSSSASSLALAAAASEKKKNQSLADDAPFHKPAATPAFSAASFPPYHFSKWTSAQQGFVIATFRGLGDKYNMTEKHKHVVELWASKAADTNEADFNFIKIPSVGEVAQFDRHYGQKRAIREVNDVFEPSMKKKRPARPGTKYHSNDLQKNDKEYLIFPVTLAMVAVHESTVRRCRAYCVALGIKFTNGQARTRLTAELNKKVPLEEGVVELARPATPPKGTWQDWFVKK